MPLPEEESIKQIQEGIVYEAMVTEKQKEQGKIGRVSHKKNSDELMTTQKK